MAFRFCSLLRAARAPLSFTTPVWLGWLVACQAHIGDPGTTDGVAAEGQTRFITTVQPAMQAANCIACHAVAPFPFFVGATARDQYHAITSSTSISLTSPASSRLITKGAHAGRALTPEETSTVRDWLTLEQKERQGASAPTRFASARLTPKRCTSASDCPLNELDLSAAGANGAKLTFRYEELATAQLIYITDLTFVAGPAGLYVEHPLFITVDGKATPDTSDDIATVDPSDALDFVKENLAPATGGAVATAKPLGGNVALPLPKGQDLQVMFTQVAPFRPEATPPSNGGCKHVDVFTSLVKPQLTPRCAPACHVGMQAGSGSMQLEGIDASDAASLGKACNQALTMVNRAVRDNSGLFIAPTPGQGTHPLKLTDDAERASYRQALLTWIDQEFE